MISCTSSELGVRGKEDLNSVNCGSIEHRWSEIGGATGRTVVGICYRPPNSSRDNDAVFYALVRSTFDDFEKVLFLGDSMHV